MFECVYVGLCVRARAYLSWVSMYVCVLVFKVYIFRCDALKHVLTYMYVTVLFV